MIINSRRYKNICSFVATLCLVLQCFIIPTYVYASQTDITDITGDYSYILTGNSAKITACHIDMSTRKIQIPKKLDGVKVTGIGEKVFYNREDLTSVSIPNTIINIGVKAFSKSGITKVVIPGSVDTIDDMAFFSCPNLKEVYILYGVRTIGDGAFADCTSLETVAMAPSLNSIEDLTFEDSENVTIQANPDSYAGQYNSSEFDINKAELPDDSPSAYIYEANEDDTIKIVEYVGTSVNPKIPDQMNGLDVVEVGDNAFKDKPIETIKLPESLRTIGTNAFAGTKITSAIIPDTVTGIGEGAFDDKKDLVLEGSCQALYDYMANMHNIIFKPYSPGSTDYRTLTVNNPLYGTISIKSGEYLKNRPIDIEAFPDYGYRLDSWTQSTSSKTFEDMTKRKTKFTMPNENTSISANFSKLQLFIEEGKLIWYTGTDDLNIPAKYGEKYGYEETGDNLVNTTRIISGAFKQSSNGGPSSITIPKTVRTIDDDVFYSSYTSNLKDITVDIMNQNYSSQDGVLFNKEKTVLIHYPSSKDLENYTVPNTVKEIRPYAFFGASKLKSITMSNSVESIGSYAFSRCANLTSLTLSNSATTMGSHAFADCTKLTDLSLPNGITGIGDYAFYNCISLTNLNLPSSITTIGDYAFSNCTGLTSLTLSNSVTNMGSHAFADCTKLTDLSLPNGITGIGDYTFYNCTSLTNLNLPSSITTIGDYAFSNCTGLTSLTLSNSVTNMGSHAFADCTKLTDLSLPNGITGIGDYAFYNCTSLTNLTLPSSITTIGSYAFSSCTGLTSLTLPNSITNMKSHAFANCTKLTDLNLSNGITGIGDYAFYNCTSLTNLTLPNTITTIGSYAFSSCTGLTSLTLPNSITNMKSHAFANCTKLTDLNLSNGITGIGSYAFTNCTSLTNLTLPNSITTIGDYAFSNCTGLINITLPNNLTKINPYTFYKCNNLISINIPDSVETVSNNSFDSCDSLITVNISSGVKNIDGTSFSNCSKLESITVDSNNNYYWSDDVALYTKDKTKLILYPMNASSTIYNIADGVKTIGKYSFYKAKNLTELIIPDGVICIETRAFDDCKKLESISMPASLTRIEDYAFYECSGLKNLSLPLGVTYIGAYAFYKCSSIESLSLPANSTYIGSYAFYGCDSITGLIIPEGVIQIGSQTFENCKNIENIFISSSVTTIGNKAFYSCEKLKAVIVNENNNNYWSDGSVLYSKDKKHLIAYPIAKEDTNYTAVNGVEIIDSLAFANSKNLESLLLPSTLKSISSQAFYYSSLLDILIDNGITSINSSSFDYATKLNKVDIPKTVTSIKANSFKYCPNLNEVIIRNGEDGIFNLTMSNSIFSSTSNLTIKAYIESTAEEYAFDRNIKFEQLDKPTEGLIVENGVLKGYTGTDTDIVLPSNITTIDTSAFSAPSNQNKIITSIKMPLSVTAIKEYAFDECSSLKQIKIRKTVTEISHSAFKGCTELEKINVDTSNKNFASIDGVLTNKSKTTIKEVPMAFTGTNGVYTIPSTIIAIESSSFSGTTKLEEIIVNNINHLRVNTFNGAFINPVKLTLNNIDDIDNGVFKNCTGITDITLGLANGYSRLGDGVFDGCENLQNIIIKGNSIYEDKDGVLFTKESSEFKSQLLKFPQGREGSYIIPDGTVAIYDGAFQNCYKLSSVTIPDSVASIGVRAFESCPLLNVEIPGGVSIIGERAFANTYLTEVSLPNTVTHILQGAFTSCDKLASASIYNPNAVIEEGAFESGESNLTIYGFINSTAQGYANSHNITFKDITGTNILVNGVNGNSIELTATVNDNIAQAYVKDIQIDAAIGNAVLSSNDSISIDVAKFVYSNSNVDVTDSVYRNCDTINIEISKDALNSVYSEENIKYVSVTTPIGNLKFNRTIIGNIIENTTSSQITISLRKIYLSDESIEDNYSLVILSNGSKILENEINQIPISH